MSRQVIERDKLGALAKIGQGGQGVVYGAPNVKTKFAASMVYKEYKTQVLADIDFTALAAMPALVEDSLSYAEAERLISIAAWPCALVEEAGTPKGFVMPAIPDEFFIDLTTVKGVSKTAAEFQHLLNHSSVLAARGIAIDDAQRYSLLREVASGLAFLHKHGVCVGDISPKNLLFSLAPHAAVYFIDCDAMRINGVSVLRQVETPGWQAPAGEELATIYSDTYKLGLLALRLLAGDHDTTNLQHIPSTTPDMLRQIITDTLSNQPHQRPLPEAWTYLLGDAIEQAQHQQKTTAPPPVSIASDAPPIPVVHSRPSAPTPYSKPPSPPPPPLPPPRPAERWPSQPAEPAPHWERHALGVGLAALIVVIVVVLATVAIKDYSRSRQPHTSQTAAAQPAPPSEQSAQPAPFSQPTAQPAPPPQPTSEPSEQYVKTPWGTRCQVTTDQITCDTCEPGLLLDTPAGAAECPGPSLNEIVVDASGTKQTPGTGVILPASPSIQQLSDGQTYDINGWTIAVSAWVRFTNDATGHGMAVAAQNEDVF
jgi:eukaryotic-like serine/threonine-protein kinase